jgi:lipopolysaccharide export system protein LptA
MLPAEESVAGTNSTVITSESLSFEYGRMIAEFEGNVVVIDPEIGIRCDRMVVMFTPENEVKSITALGNVRMHSGDRRGTCERAVYAAATGEVVLTGNARLSRARDYVEGDSITFWLNEERVVCKPGRLVIHPASRSGRTSARGLVRP